MRLEHNSHNTFYRSPFGAISSGTMITLRIYVESFSPPETVQLIINDKKIGMYYLSDMMFGRVYEAKFKLETPQLAWYYFYVESDHVSAFYGNNAKCLGGVGVACTAKPTQQFQITVYDGTYKTPNWLKHAIFYQIFPDRFFRGAETPIKGIKRTWGDIPYYKAEQFGGEYLANDFFGGNLQGITEKLPYLHSLGVNALYLNPIFEASTNHKYDTGDYEHVDACFGGTEAFVELSAKAAELGIRIILDGVFNHTGSNSKYFNINRQYDTIGAYQSTESPYFSWYKFQEHPDRYDCWWGFRTLPDLNEMSHSLRKYLLSDKEAIVKKWLRLGASGWRLDVVDELPGFFVKELAKNVKDTDPEACIIGEVWEDASNKSSYGEQREYFLGYELDSVMNYPLRTAILDYLLPSGDAAFLSHTIMSLMENYPIEHFYSTLNLISSHDVVRALTVLAEAPTLQSREQQVAFSLSEAALSLGNKRLRLATILQMTLPGAPCIYYGDEAGMHGFSDPFNRMCYPWGHQDYDLLDFFRDAIKLRNTHTVLRTGKFTPLNWAGKVFAFARHAENGHDVFGEPCEDQTLIIAINSDAKNTYVLPLDVGRLAIDELQDYAVASSHIQRKGVFFPIQLEPLTARIFIGKSKQTV